MFAGFGNTIALPQRTAVSKHAADISSLEIEALTKRSRLKLDSACLSEDTRPRLPTPLPEPVLDDIFPDTLLDDAAPMRDGASPRPTDNQNPNFVVPFADTLIDNDCTDTEIEEDVAQTRFCGYCVCVYVLVSVCMCFCVGPYIRKGCDFGMWGFGL